MRAIKSSPDRAVMGTPRRQAHTKAHASRTNSRESNVLSRVLSYFSDRPLVIIPE